MAHRDDRTRERERELRDTERRSERLEKDMERRSERLEEEIEDVREDWERKKRDPSVPGAAGDPERADREPPPEAGYPSKGD